MASRRALGLGRGPGPVRLWAVSSALRLSLCRPPRPVLDAALLAPPLPIHSQTWKHLSRFLSKTK